MSHPSKLTIWITAARLRTLPLSIAGIVTGNALALNQPNFSWSLFIGALLTAIMYQILSNFANDYGDGVKGTDNQERLGPKRVLQQRLLSASDLYRGIVFTAILSFLFSLVLIYNAFGKENLQWMGLFIVLSLAAIWAAYNYTVGEKAYGYYALGDLFVFLFFGGIAVGGAYFLQTQSLTEEVILYMLAMGGLSVGVLNLNNMRDRENDQYSNKNTIATLLGFEKSRNYQYALVIGSILAIGVAIAANTHLNINSFLPLLICIPLLFQLRALGRITHPKSYDRYLKPLALSTFGLSVLVFISKWLAL